MTPREGFQIEITGIPAENAKCRVETQLKIGLCIKDAQGEIARQWKQFRLPRDLIAKEKHRLTKYNGRDKNIADSEILTLESRLVCHQDMAKVLECCENCIGRERKRAHRRKETQMLPGALISTQISGMQQQHQHHHHQQQQHQKQQLNTNTNIENSAMDDGTEDMIPPSPTEPAAYEAWERSRIIVFSTTQYVNASSGECTLPTRITCYCRHHGEKIGFRILFTARDWTGAIVTSALTNPVMMMDDHKSGKKPPTRPTSVIPEMNTTRRSESIPTLSCPPTPAMDSTYYFERTSGTNLNTKLEAMEEDELDLEAGRPEPYIDDDDDDDEERGEWANKETDTLPSLNQLPYRVTSKRRVDDEQRKEDTQMQQTFKRKTSHGILPTPAGFDVPIKSEPQTPAWPFIPGSPFANDDKHNVFAPSFSQAILGLPAHPTSWDDAFTHRIKDENEQFSAESRSMMEDFTTLDGSMSSPPSRPAPIQTRASFTIPMMDYTNNDMLMQLPSSASSSSTFQDAFQTAFGSEQHHFINLQDSQQQQTQQNYHPMTSVSQPPVSSAAWVPFSAPMMTPNMDAFQFRMPSNITHHPSSSAFMQIPVVTSEDPSVDEQMQEQYRRSSSVSSTSGVQWKKEERSDSIDGTSSSVPKKRGRPRKTQVGVSTSAMGSSSSAASSPMVSPKAPSMNMPPSPSPPPYSIPQATLSSTATTVSTGRALNNASTVAAAQFLLLHQHQQLQLQMQHQQQQQLVQQHQKQTNPPRSSQSMFPPMLLMQADPVDSAAVAAVSATRGRPSGLPRVQKVIPARGPTHGGIEVTLLGTGFFPGMIPVFDGVPALNIQFYGAETVICQLPPRAIAGPVLVQAMMGQDLITSEPLEKNDTGVALSILGGTTTTASKGGVFFEYEEDKGDRDLMGLALQVLGMKMNGRVESPQQIAMRIMGTAAAAEAAQQQKQQQRLLQQQSHQQHQQLFQTKLIQQFPSSAVSAPSFSMGHSITIPVTVESPTPTELAATTIAPTTTAVVSSKPTMAAPTATTGTNKAPLTRTLTTASFASNFTPIQLQSPQSQLLFQDRARPLPQR